MFVTDASFDLYKVPARELILDRTCPELDGYIPEGEGQDQQLHVVTISNTLAQIPEQDKNLNICIKNGKISLLCKRSQSATFQLLLCIQSQGSLNTHRF